MKKLSTILVSIFVIFNIGIVSLAGLTLLTDSDANANTPRSRASPEDYAENNIYYLINPTMTSTLQYLKGVPRISDGSDPNLNKLDMDNGRPYYFVYPGGGARRAVLELNHSFNGNPYLCLIVNSYTTRDKVVSVEVGIDTDNDNSFEVVCTFPPHRAGMGNMAYQHSVYMEKMGHNVTVLTPNYSNEKIKNNWSSYPFFSVNYSSRSIIGWCSTHT